MVGFIHEIITDLMKIKLTILCFVLLLFTSNNLYAQTDTATKPVRTDSSLVAKNNRANTPNDEEFNLFLFSLLAVAICGMVGATIIGAFAATMVVLMSAALISFGILSISVLAGLYKRSIAAGFKTLLYIICPIGGAVIGMSGFLLADKLFEISIPVKKGLLAGAIGGVIGGIIMAFAVSKIVVVLARFFWNKLNRTGLGNLK